MATFLSTFFERLAARGDADAIIETHGEVLVPTSAAALSRMVGCARATLNARGVTPGDRVVLLAPNSARWVAADLAILAEGAICVPMYARQAADELVHMMDDAEPSLIVCADEKLASGIRELLTGDGDTTTRFPIVCFEAFFDQTPVTAPPLSRGDDDDVTIIYTSGTSGEPKGVVLSGRNIDYMLPIISAAIADMMGSTGTDHRVFHYLPFCFAGSRMVLWMCLFRGNPLMASTDLNNLAVELKAARPNYVLNVPALLERIRGGVEAKIRGRHKAIQGLYDHGMAAFDRIAAGKGSLKDKATYGVAKRIVFDKIRAQIGPELRCLICGSAPLGEDTQRWFEMIGLAVYQVYGLTETTAIVTMDKPSLAVPGRVGYPIAGAEVRLAAGDELQVRSPGIFGRYWRKPEATTEAFTEDGWFRSGDQVEIDSDGNYRIVGRVKNVLVPSSGHNVAPEPIEQKLVETIEGVEQAVVIGHARPYLTAIVTGAVPKDKLEQGIDRVNGELPHYRRIRRFHLSEDVFTPENGLLTANQKLKRKVIEEHYRDAVEGMYA